MSPTAEDLMRADRAHVIHPLHHPIDNASPIIYVSGRGVMVRDIDGREYIDGLSGLWNVNVGHGRAELADAAAAQMKELAYFSGYVGSANVPSIKLAERLTEIAGEHGSGLLHERRRGGERVGVQDRALLLEGAGQARQGQDHRAAAGLSRPDAAGDERDRDRPRVLEDVRAARAGLRPHPDVLSVPLSRREGRARRSGEAAARELEETILREGADTVAAFIAEPIHGTGGVFYPTDDYWPRIREVCSRHNVLLIADEIITGFCRTGKLVRARTLEREARHSHVCQRRHVRIPAARRDNGDQGDQAGDGRSEAGGSVAARVHLLGASDLLRRRVEEHRNHGARAALGERGAHGRSAARGPARGVRRIIRTSATFAAARGCSPPWNSSRIARRSGTSRRIRRWRRGFASR